MGCAYVKPLSDVKRNDMLALAAHYCHQWDSPSYRVFGVGEHLRENNEYRGCAPFANTPPLTHTRAKNCIRENRLVKTNSLNVSVHDGPFAIIPTHTKRRL